MVGVLPKNCLSSGFWNADGADNFAFLLSYDGDKILIARMVVKKAE